MKKLVIIGTLIATFSGAAFGQGYFLFTGTKSTVYDGFTGSSAGLTSNVNVAFLWAASGVPQVDSILAAVPTTATTLNQTWTAAAAWTAILTDPNFTLALNANSGNAVVVQQTTSQGAWSYNGGAVFGINGTTAGTAVQVFEIGWSSAYATPALASAASAAVGWSGAWAYTPTLFTASPNTMTAPAHWGTGGLVPEPSTLALAGLGGLGLLLFRRRK